MEDAYDLADLKRILRPDEVADELRVSRSTVYRLIEEGKLPHVKVGGQKRIRRCDLLAYLTPENMRELY